MSQLACYLSHSHRGQDCEISANGPVLTRLIARCTASPPAAAAAAAASLGNMTSCQRGTARRRADKTSRGSTERGWNVHLSHAARSLRRHIRHCCWPPSHCQIKLLQPFHTGNFYLEILFRKKTSHVTISLYIDHVLFGEIHFRNTRPCANCMQCMEVTWLDFRKRISKSKCQV